MTRQRVTNGCLNVVQAVDISDVSNTDIVQEK